MWQKLCESFLVNNFYLRVPKNILESPCGTFPTLFLVRKAITGECSENWIDSEEALASYKKLTVIIVGLLLLSGNNAD